MELNFKITEEFIKNLPEKDFEVFERLQDGESLRIYKLKPVLARAMVDKNGQAVPYKQALEMLGEIPVGDYKHVIKQFTDGLLGATVPKESGRPLNSPLEVPSTVSASPDGSVS